MNLVISLLLFLFFPVALLVLFILVIVYSFTKKWKTVRRLGIAFSLILIFELWEFDCFPGATSYHLAESFKESTGYFFAPKEIFAYESERNITGDGNSIWVYQLDDEAVKYFSSLKEGDDFFQKFPEKDDYYRKDWNIQHWMRTPIGGDDTTVLNFAIDTYFPSEVAPDQIGKLREYVKLAKTLAHENGNLVAFLYKYGKTSPYDVDFYIISPKRKLCIIANSNM
jgi:hypothetical protein